MRGLPGREYFPSEPRCWACRFWGLLWVGGGLHLLSRAGCHLSAGEKQGLRSGTFAGPLMKLTSKPACRARKEGAHPAPRVQGGLARYPAAQPLAFSVPWGKSFNLWFFPLQRFLPSSPPGEDEKSLVAVCQISSSFT